MTWKEDLEQAKEDDKIIKFSVAVKGLDGFGDLGMSSLANSLFETYRKELKIIFWSYCQILCMG